MQWPGTFLWMSKHIQKTFRLLCGEEKFPCALHISCIKIISQKEESKQGKGKSAECDLWGSFQLRYFHRCKVVSLWDVLLLCCMNVCLVKPCFQMAGKDGGEVLEQSSQQHFKTLPSCISHRNAFLYLEVLFFFSIAPNLLHFILKLNISFASLFHLHAIFYPVPLWTGRQQGQSLFSWDSSKNKRNIV